MEREELWDIIGKVYSKKRANVSPEDYKAACIEAANYAKATVDRATFHDPYDFKRVILKTAVKKREELLVKT